MIKVLIVDDSAFMRKLISDIIFESAQLEVIGKVRNGKEALEFIKNKKPDVITMDVEMPIMNGIEAVEKIMAFDPVPVVMLSAVTKKGAESTLAALEAGAVDFITKPKSIFKVKDQSVKEAIIEKLIIASRVNLQQQKKYINHIVKRKPLFKGVKRAGNKVKKIIAIGTSTGGPRALQEVIPRIPGNINAAILVVQHMPPGFTKSLSDRLDSMSEVTVIEASGNEELMPGTVYVAPGDQHLKVKKSGGSYYTYLEDSDLVSGHKPSVDALFASLNENNIKNVIGVLLTGMGKDGARELKKLKDNNNYTIVQDEKSCVVFGMPKSAINMKAVNEIVELRNIANSIIKAMEV